MNPLGEKQLPKRTDLKNDIDACLKWLHLLKQHINATRREEDMEKDEWLHIKRAATLTSGIAEKAEFAFDKEKMRQKMEVEEKRRKAQKAKEDKEAEDRRARVLAAEQAAKDKRKKELADAEKRKKQNSRNQVPAAHGKAPEPHRKGVHFQTPTPNSKEGTPQERFDKAARDYNEACQQHTAAKQRYMQSSSSKNVKLRDAAMKREMVASAAYSEAHAGLARAKAKEREEKEEKEKMFMSPAARKRKDDNDRRQEEEDAKGKESARALASEVRKF